ncbi:MAG: phage/plasmid primase, P4 family [Arcobacteraceae bacterium]|jgi:putative DNA primase/helicase|nr:phage/plasmid primase, P4 family [Arcobacteraceae bacterium]
MENEAMNTDTVIDEEIEIDEENKVYDEKNAEEIAVIKIWNALLHFIVCFNPFTWGKIHDELNEGIVGKKVASKDCYRIGFIDNLKKFARDNNILFAKDGNHFYSYNGEYWIKISEDFLKGFLHKASKKMGIPDSLSSCVKFIKSTYEQLIESGFFVKMVQNDVTYLNLLNGTLKIDKNGVELILFNSKHFLTHQLDFKYDKNSVNQIWLDFLDMVLPDKDTQKTLQQAIGYLFIRDLKLEKIMFLYGIGSNGKSVIFEVIKGILASEMMSNYSLASLTNHLGYQLADLNNKLINYGTDISMKNVDLAIFKQIASGEPIGTRQIREKSFTMKSYAKLIFNVNKLDDADVENTHGFGRRLLFIPFEQVIEKKDQDKNLHKKILENKAGVMNWIIEGIEEVLINEEIYISEKCENFLDNFKRESSPIQLFLEDSHLISVSQDTNETMDFQQMYEMYREFCKKQGEKPVAQRNLNADLKRLGFEFKRKKQGNVWFIRVK